MIAPLGARPPCDECLDSNTPCMEWLLVPALEVVGAMGPEQEHYERLAYTTLVARASSKSLRYLHSTRQALSLVPGCSRRERKGGAFRTDAAEWSGPS